MSPLCVVLGVFHCRYCGVVGFVACPHSVLSLGCSTVDIVGFVVCPHSRGMTGVFLVSPGLHGLSLMFSLSC